MDQKQLAATRNELTLLRVAMQTIRSANALTYAMAEAGMLYYRLLQAGLVPSHDMLIHLGKHAEKHSKPLADTQVADFSYMNLFMMACEMFSERQRLVLKPAPSSGSWTIQRSSQASEHSQPEVRTEEGPKDVSLQTNWNSDYEKQGYHYSMFLSEIIAQLPEKLEASAAKPTPKVKRKADREKLVTQLRGKIQQGYTSRSYAKLKAEIGGSVGTWANIFKAKGNEDLREWKDNRGVYARNASEVVEQRSYEEDEYLPDEDIEKILEKAVSRLPANQREEARAAFASAAPDKRTEWARMYAERMYAEDE